MAYPPTRNLARRLAARFHEPVATVTALADIPAEERHDGMLALVTADNSSWVFSSSSTAADTTSQLVVTPSAGSGRWLRADKHVNLKLARAFSTADAAVLFTVPTGFKLDVRRTFNENTVAWSGGTNSAIGASSSNAAYNTKGDLEGGAGGDLAAAMGTGYKPGSAIGTKFGSNGIIILVAGDTIRHDRIVDAYTAGSGFLHVQVAVIQ